MHPEQKKRLVGDLIADLGGLGPRFEPFGYEFIEFIAPGNWTHRGTTTDGAPVGHSVDSKSDGRWIAEFGTQKDYFAGDLKKIKADIAHARQLHPQVERVWALSNQEAGPSVSTSLEQLRAHEKQHGLDLVVLDSREIALKIVDNLFNEPFIEALRDYLPTLARIRDEWAASHRIPVYADYVPRPRVEAEAMQRLANDRALSIVGLGGAGKSAIASALALQLRADFEVALWIDADGLKRVEDLSSIDVLRNGGSLNVHGLMRTRKSLVVLDNLTTDLNVLSLLRDSHPETRIITTAQFSTTTALKLGDLEPAEAKVVLDPSGTCPAEVLEEVLARIGGHPLLLTLLRGIANDAGWVEVSALLSEATELEDAHGRVCERIVGRHRHSLGHAFRLVAVAGARIDGELWDQIAGRPARRAFNNRHFLAAGDVDIVRVHDVVAASIDAICKGEDLSEIHAQLARFIESQMGETHSMTMQRVVRTHYTLFERLLRGGAVRPALRYAYALSRRPGMDLTLLGDPVSLADELSPSDPDIAVAVRAIIETIECTFTVLNSTNKVAAKAKLAEHFPTFSKMLALAAVRVNETETAGAWIYG